MSDAAESQIESLPGPQKSFLKRGEGTARRVYASRYKAEATKKRHENQQRSLERQGATGNGRREIDDDRFVDLRDSQSKTFPHKSATDDGKSQIVALKLEEDSSPPFRLGTDRSASPSFQREITDHSAIESIPFREQTPVDGSCRLESEENGLEDPSREEAILRTEAKRSRESRWLETQRRHEDQQWIEAEELREFEALEKQIAEETNRQLEKAVSDLKQKKVTFRDQAAFEEGMLLTPSGTLKDADGIPKIAAAKEEKRPHGNSPVQREGFEKLKTMSAARGTKPRSAARSSRSKTYEGRISVQTRTPCTRKPGLRASSLQSSATKGFSDAVSDVVADQGFVVDSSFLDRLVEQDFREDNDSERFHEREQNDRLFAEKLRLQSMREDLEDDKREWQQTQAKAMEQFAAVKAEELKKLKRERRVLEQQSKALLKLPNKKERSEIESLEALLEAERKESRSKEARHKLTMERLKDQIQQLQTSNKELQEEVKWYEGMRLKRRNQEETQDRSVMTFPPAALDIGTQMDRTQESSPLYEGAYYGRDKWAVRLENPFYSETSTQDSQTKQDPAVTGFHRTNVNGGGLEEQYQPELVDRLRHPPYGLGATNTFSEARPHVFSLLDQEPRPSGQWQMSDSVTSGGRGFQADPRTIPYVGFDQRRPFFEFPSYSQQRTAFGYPAGDTFCPLPMYPAHRAHDHLNLNTELFPPQSQSTNGPLLDIPTQPATRQVLSPIAAGFEHSLYSNSGMPPLNFPTSSVPKSESEPTRQAAERNPSFGHQREPSGVGTSQGGKDDHLTATPRRVRYNSSSAKVSAPSLARDAGKPCVQPSGSLPSKARCKGESSQDDRKVVCVEPSEELSPTGACHAYRAETASVATFDNGTIKQTYPGGRVVVWFANGDVKHVHPCGRVEYFYADLNTWQVTHSTNVDVFYFDIGQVEAHKPNGDKDIAFPDGTIRLVSSDG